jgi:uncharacterized membrane protein YcaP (DUF421 family)
MLTMSTSPFEILARVVAIYAFLFVMMRIIGKRHAGELAPFDLVVLLMLSETVQNAMIGDEKSLTGGILAAGVLFGVSQIVSYVAWRFKAVERVLDGKPRFLVRHGVIDEAAMAAEQITRSELFEALRKEGITTLSRVRYAVLENDGAIAVGERRSDVQTLPSGKEPVA